MGKGLVRVCVWGSFGLLGWGELLSSFVAGPDRPTDRPTLPTISLPPPSPSPPPPALSCSVLPPYLTTPPLPAPQPPVSLPSLLVVLGRAGRAEDGVLHLRRGEHRDGGEEFQALRLLWLFECGDLFGVG